MTAMTGTVRCNGFVQALVVAVLCLTSHLAAAQDAGALTIESLRTQIEQAREQDVAFLAPTAFEEAIEALAAAQHDAQKGRRIDRINAKVGAGLASMRAAHQSAKIARENFASAVRTRNDALAANPARFDTEGWAEAEKRFREAMIRNERGDANGAQRRVAEAEVLMRESELEAIKNRLLGTARDLIARAHKQKVKEVAPRTLTSAERLLGQAEHEIARNRYDLAISESLVRDAEYEARHAIYLAQVIRDMLKKEGDDQHALEAMLLAYEGPLQKIAVEVNTAARFDGSAQAAMHEILQGVQQRQQELTRVRQELEDRNGEISELKAQLKRLDDRLGGVSEERLVLQRRVAEQDALRANAAAIESAFSPNEARIYRQGDDVVISLTGINFGVGRSTVEPSSAPLLKKVQDAINRFPGSPIVVEGHTDSNGSDSTNLILSQDRADAVKEYLVRTAGVNPESISSIGYGEARPVASNETSEGRSRNRRIDLVIRTSM